MRSVVVVVTDVLLRQAFQMLLVQNDHMVKQVPAAATHPTLGNAVLPWTLEAGTCWLNAKDLYYFGHFAIEV